MSRTTIDRLIINSPYQEPARHWRYERETRTFHLAEGRRPAGYVVASGDSRACDDPGIFVEIPLVNQIRSPSCPTRVERTVPRRRPGPRPPWNRTRPNPLLKFPGPTWCASTASSSRC
jgi:hypothetical protein